VSLGEGFTPLVRAPGAPGVWLKLDFLMPTLSFKDRGAVLVAELARRLGVPAAVADSSGNAGTALAAYLARAGIRCEVFVPAATSPAKLDQMRAHGAEVRLVPGGRANAARAAQEVADGGVFYASHVYQPYFLHGTKTYGYEVWEQLGGRVPDAVVVPVGNGTLLLGCHLAFEELRTQGRTDRTPRIIGVQAAACAPLAAAMAVGHADPVPVTAGSTKAEGIAIADPARGAQVLAAVRASGGDIVTVTDSEVADARADLAAAGLFVEPTSAVCWAVARRASSGRAVPGWPDGGEVVVPLCGAGLKSR
jgi:threonine synthase